MHTIEQELITFELPLLQFDPASFEPHISQKTMDIHYGKHHQGYVDKLNKALEASSEDWAADLSVEDLLKQVSKYGDAIRNNAGGHYNHTLFWKSLSSQEMQPFGRLKEHMLTHFDSIEAFREEFKAAATDHFGSGWVWLIYTEDDRMRITTTPDQDNPLMDVVTDQGYPLLGLDIWEHAYYLDYQNRKGDYIDAFWNLVDWIEVSRRYNDARLKENRI